MPLKDGVWVPEDSSVAGQVAKLQTQDSPLMRNAQAQGQRVANRRGLGNSSIAAGAVTSATLSAITPIASQDAQQIHSSNLQYGEHKQQDRVTTANIAASDRANYVNALVGLGGNYQSGIANTLQNSKIPAATRSAAQRDIGSLYSSQQQQLAAIYGVKLNWGQPTAGGV